MKTIFLLNVLKNRQSRIGKGDGKKKTVIRSGNVIIALIIAAMCLVFSQSNAQSTYAVQIMGTSLWDKDTSIHEGLLDWCVEHRIESVVVDALSRNAIFFPSPTMEPMEEFEYQGNHLGRFVRRAHEKDLRVIAEMQWINDNFGREVHFWTARELDHITQEILDTGVDGIIEEDFETRPEWLWAICDACERNNSWLIHKTQNSVAFGWWNRGWFSLTPFDIYAKADEINLLQYAWDREETDGVDYNFSVNMLIKALAVGMGKSVSSKIYWSTRPGQWLSAKQVEMLHGLLITALQFRNEQLVLWLPGPQPEQLPDLSVHQPLIDNLTAKQFRKPVLNVVLHLRYNDNGQHLRWSGEAIAGGGLLAGYDVVATDKPLLDADAYYLVTRGTNDYGTFDLTPDLVRIVQGDKPVFLQCLDYIPSGTALTDRWHTTLQEFGVKAETALAEGEIPLMGEFKRKPIGYAARNLTTKEAVQQATIIPMDQITGEILSQVDGTPFLIRKGNKYMFTGCSIHYSNAFTIANLLGNTLQEFADVLGVTGQKVSAFFALGDTHVDCNLPGSPESIRVRVFDRNNLRLQDERQVYNAPFRMQLNQGDLLIIESTDQ